MTSSTGRGVEPRALDGRGDRRGAEFGGAEGGQGAAELADRRPAGREDDGMVHGSTPRDGSGQEKARAESYARAGPPAIPGAGASQRRPGPIYNGGALHPPAPGYVPAASKAEGVAMDDQRSPWVDGLTIGAVLREAARRHGGNDAMVFPEAADRCTFAEFDRRVDDVARGLLAMGFERGDHLGVWSTNWPEWVLLQFATARIGVVLVTVNPSYRAHEAGYALAQSEVRGLALIASIQDVRLFRHDPRGLPRAASRRPGRTPLRGAAAAPLGRGDAGRAGAGDARLGRPDPARPRGAAGGARRGARPGPVPPTRSTCNTPPARPEPRRGRRSRTGTS